MTNIKNISKKFGTILIIGYRKINKTPYYEVLCDCGNKQFLTTNCILRKKPMCSKCRKKDKDIDKSKYIGKKFGKLTVLTLTRIDKVPYFLILCECGYEEYLSRNSIFSKNPMCSKCREKMVNENTEKRIGEIHKNRIITGTIKTKHRYLYKFKCIQCNEEKTLSYARGLTCGCRKCYLLNMFGENHPTAKLSKKEVRSLRELGKTGLYSYYQLSKLFKYSNVSNIINNKERKRG